MISNRRLVHVVLEHMIFGCIVRTIQRKSGPQVNADSSGLPNKLIVLKSLFRSCEKSPGQGRITPSLSHLVRPAYVSQPTNYYRKRCKFVLKRRVRIVKYVPNYKARWLRINFPFYSLQASIDLKP